MKRLESRSKTIPTSSSSSPIKLFRNSKYGAFAKCQRLEISENVAFWFSFLVFCSPNFQYELHFTQKLNCGASFDPF